jgi:hypothetical protein
VRKGKTTWRALEETGLAVPESVVFPVEVKKPPGKWTSREVFESEKFGTCRTEIGAARRTGLPRTSLRKWSYKPCRYNEGESIFTLGVRPPIVRDDPVVRVFLDSVIDRVAENYRKVHEAWARPQTANDGLSDDAYVPMAELIRALKVSKDQILHWANKRSILHRGEKALRRHLETSTDAKRVRNEQFVYRVGDMRTILQGKESTHPRVGRPARRRPGTLTDHEARKILWDYLFANGPATKKAFFEYCRSQQISGTQRKAALQRHKWRPPIRSVQVGAGVHKVCYYCLPGQEPPRLPHAPVIRKAADLLQGALADGPVLLQKLLKLARQHGMSQTLLFEAKKIVGVVQNYEWRGSRRFAWWKLARAPQAKRPSAEPTPQTDGQAKGLGAQAGMSMPAPPSSVTDFIPSAFQMRILKALDAKALTADNLQARLSCDRKTLYARGLRELMQHDVVRNNRRIGGYYLPNRPPPEYGEFLGKNSESETV